MFVEIDGRQVNVAAFGAGSRTFVAFGTWVFGWELWQWPMELLSASWRTVAYDHRGSGETAAAPDDITLEGLIDDLIGVLDSQGIGRCVLGAESSGGVLAIAAVLRHPERFSGLVLAAGVPMAVAGPEAVAGIRADFPRYVASFADRCIPAPEHDHIRRWLRDMAQRSEPEQAARLFECLYGCDYRPQLPDLRLPTLLLHGSADQVVPVAISETMAQALPNHRLVLLDGGDHGPSLTRAAEVAAAIDAYFPAG